MIKTTIAMVLGDPELAEERAPRDPPRPGRLRRVVCGGSFANSIFGRPRPARYACRSPFRRPEPACKRPPRDHGP